MSARNSAYIRTTTCWLLIIGALFFNVVRAQQLHFVNYNVKEGLAQSQVYAICQDRRGYMWFGTVGGGASRFDGTNFRTFTVDHGLRGNDISDIIETKDGRLWFACKGTGLTVYDGHSFKSYSRHHGIDFPAEATLLEDEEGLLWIATMGAGVFTFDGKDFKQLDKSSGLRSDTVNCLHLRPDGGLMAATPAGIMVWKEGEFSPWAPGEAEDAPDGNIRYLESDSAGALWIGGRGLWKYDGKAFSRFDEVTGPGAIQHIFFDSKNRIWLGGSVGVGCLEKGDYKFLRNQPGLWDLGVYQTYEDRNGNVWFGTSGGGVSKFMGDLFVHYGEGTILEKVAVFSIEELEENKYWVGAENGLYLFENHAFSLVENFPGNGAFVYEIEKDDWGNVFIASQQGTFRYNGRKFSRIEGSPEFSRFPATGIGRDNDGQVWLSHRLGYYTVQGDSARSRAEMHPAFAYWGAGFLQQANGDIWLLTRDEGVIRYRNGEVRHFTVDDGLPSNRGINIAEDHNGRIWVGTDGGLVKFDGDSFCYLTHRDGLNADIVYILQPDRQGNIWAGTEAGLNRIRLDENSNPIGIRTYASEEGFIGEECNQGAGTIDRRGVLWFGTIYGLTGYRPWADIPNEDPPQIYLNSVRLHLEEVDWEDRGLEVQAWNGLPKSPEFQADENHLRFDYKAVTMRLPEKVRYKYKMEGLDEDWSPATHETHAVYSHIPAGDYTFKVKAANSDGIWTESPATFSFSVLQPFYKTWWFTFLWLGTVFLMIYMFVRIRINNLDRQKKLLEEKVRERTQELEKANRVKSEFLAKMSHEIRTPMNGVIGMTDLLRRTELNEQQRKFVENVRVSGRNLLSLINDILDFSRIESGKLDLESVPMELRQLVEEVLDILAYGAYDKGLELLYWVDPEIRGPINADPARLKQVLVNLVGNAIKFTNMGRVIVRVHLESRDQDSAIIRISVEDSGIGIPKEKFGTLFQSFTQVDASTTRKYGGTGLGLAISYQLAKMMGGDMWVESELGKGAEFIFTIKAGLSAPWDAGEGEHPAASLNGQKVAIAIDDEECQRILEEYLEHWKAEVIRYDSLEAITDALLDGTEMEFLIVDTRLFSEQFVQPAIHFAETCARLKVNYALLSEPSIAISLQSTLNDYGWLLSKPLKRDDLLDALLGKRSKDLVLTGIGEGERLADALPMRILIAEDNPINMDVAQGMLRNLGYEPSGAENGVQVLESIEKEDFDVVFMDVQMPEMDGLEATERIIANYPRGRRPLIVAMTANAMESDRQRCLDAGMDTFISKPFVMDELVAMIRSIHKMGEAGQFRQSVTNGTPTEEAPEIEEENVAETPPEAETPSDATGDNGGKLTDLSVLMEASGGDEMFIKGVLMKLVIKVPEAVEELKEAAANKDWETVRATAHRTKSSAAYSGSDKLKDMFRDLEHIARAEEGLETVNERIVELEDYSARVTAELQEWLDNH